MSALAELEAARDEAQGECSRSCGEPSFGRRGHVLKLRGLPYATIAEQVVEFLSPTAPVANGTEVIRILVYYLTSNSS